MQFRHSKPQSLQCSIRKREKYDVFLSFRGPDVRKTLVDHLHQSLSNAGVNVFIDSEKLEKGKNIGMNLEQAIQNSTIYIPIFSPDYANSAWCLKELSLMWNIMKSTTTYPKMIPLFFNVEPSEVRYVEHSGPYAEAFNKHRTQSRHSMGEIQGWKEALRGVSGLSGWSLKETSSGYEGKLVKQVVKDVLQKLDIGVLDVAKRPVGLTSRTEEVIQRLKLGDHTSDRLTLGIWGMGGLGKTTLSKALYNKIHDHFEASCFVSNVKLEEHNQGLRKLQQQILRDLLKTQIKVNDIYHGKNLLRNHLASLRALVVLDDVDHVRQLDALMGDWFGEGSRVIITTQDSRVLELMQVDVIYPMGGLDHAEAVELFSWYAFLRDHPERGYEDMTERIVKACSCLPLSLEIIGTDLYNRNETSYWLEALHKLESVGHDSGFETLKISYDNLAPVVKHIFLDIACFFVNLKSDIFFQNRAFNMDFYAKFWSALGCESVYTSLKILEEKALIVVHEHRYIVAIDEDVDEEDHTGQYLCEFSMHEQIRDMGRRIVREESWNDPTKRSRIWRQEDVSTLMAATTVQENSRVEGLMWRRHMELQHIDTLAPMQKLNFLLLWKLEVKAEIKRLPTNLKYLVLSECQLKSYNPQMAGVESGSNQNGSSVLCPVLPKSISQLINLRYLDMSGTKQSCLPKEVCELHCLEELYLSRCNLKVLPEAFGNLTKLETLDVSNNFLSEFPTSFKRLKSLMNLEMAWNEELDVFPALPKNLITLNARRCSKFQVISLQNPMKKLKTTDLSYCKNLTQLPPLQWWKSLRNLNLDGCKRLVKLDPLPPTVTSLRSSGCSGLQKCSFTPVYGERIEKLAFSASYYREEQTGGSEWSLASDHSDLPEKQRLCMIGCDNIRLNIYQLLKDLNNLEQLDLSVSSGEEMPGETQPLLGHKNLRLERRNSTVAILFCFVLNRNENVRLPQMEVVMTFLVEDRDCQHLRTFKLPSRVTEDDSGKNILRVCVCKTGSSSPAIPFSGGGMISCSYNVQDQLSPCGSPVLLKQVEILLLETDATSQIATQLLREWKLLNDNAGEEREVSGIERDATSQIITEGEVVEVVGIQRDATSQIIIEGEVVGNQRDATSQIITEREVVSIQRDATSQVITEEEVIGIQRDATSQVITEGEVVGIQRDATSQIITEGEVVGIQRDATSQIITEEKVVGIQRYATSQITTEGEVVSIQKYATSQITTEGEVVGIQRDATSQITTEGEAVSIQRDATSEGKLLSSSNDIGEEREVVDIERDDPFQIITEFFHEWELLSSSNTITEQRETSSIERDATSELTAQLLHEWESLSSSNGIADASSQIDTQVLHEWELISSSNDIVEEDTEVVDKKRKEEENKCPNYYSFIFILSFLVIVLVKLFF